MPYGDIKGYIPENDGFKMKMGSKEKFDNSSHFSMKDTELIQASPFVKKLVGDQHKLPTELKEAILDSPFEKKGKDDKVEIGKGASNELEGVSVYAKSPKTIADNVRQNQERTVKNRLYAKTDKEKKDIAQGRFSRSRKDVSDQDYRIYKKTKKS